MPRTQQPILTGVEECDAMLREVGTKIGNRAARGVLARAAGMAAKKIKAKVPSSLKSVRRSIGSSVKKQGSGADRGIVKAKAGAGVGKKNKKPEGGTKGGLGIEAANVHWYILGTKDRKQKTSGRDTGKMPEHPIVQEAMASGGGEIVGFIKREMRPAIEREVEKAAKRLLKRRR